MTSIKDILKINLDEDIKSVIDLEDYKEIEIQKEIESYIITENIAKYFSVFLDKFTSNISETGVWVSGFYGSGKSYFGKMLGYLLDNPSINGTDVITRFITRLEGLNNAYLLENDIRNIENIKNKVVLLDIAKQNTSNGLAFTLFFNFLKKLGFRTDVYGYIEYDFFINGDYNLLKKNSLDLFGEDWDKAKNNKLNLAGLMKKLYMKTLDKSEADYEQTLKIYNNSIQKFSATDLKDELKKYLDKYKNENIVFIFDEASEAISQNKFSLLDLEGVSEALSSIKSKVWTIAIAQQKLDDVINNMNINKSDLIKVTDRFKTKIHLESTDVDIIIKNRLLQKNNDALGKLNDYFMQNNGNISEITNLNSTHPTKTKDNEEFSTYYPFHNYHFKLLQDFLFSSNALTANQMAARGMIITTFDVLKDIKNNELFNFTTLYDICSRAQVAPPEELSIKYRESLNILKEQKLAVNGESLLKVIHVLSNSGVIDSTLDNITKAYIHDINDFYTIKPLIEDSLSILVESGVLLFSNNKYKITSNQETKLIDEMKNHAIELYTKKRNFTNFLRDIKIFKNISTIKEGEISYNFRIKTDKDDDEIVKSKNKSLNFTVTNLYDIGNIEDLKNEKKQNPKNNNIVLIPNNIDFILIDKLLTDIEKYNYILNKYSSDTDKKIKEIIREFNIIKEEKLKSLTDRIEDAYLNGFLIYNSILIKLNKENFNLEINKIEKKLIDNVYTKKLSSQLSENLATAVIKRKNNKDLSKLFEKFSFFDDSGRFIGDNLSIVEEIRDEIKNGFVSGKDLEEKFSEAPWGYSYGSIVTVLAVLFRAGRLEVKYNDFKYQDYRKEQVYKVFDVSREFKKASFKYISKVLSASKKTELVEALQNLKYDKYIGKEISFNINDIELVKSIKVLAEFFILKINSIKRTVANFKILSENINNAHDILIKYDIMINTDNYIDKADVFLSEYSEIEEKIKYIIKVEKFIDKKMENLNIFKTFINEVDSEIKKTRKENEEIKENYERFNELYNGDIVNNFSEIKEIVQIIRDEYFKITRKKIILMTNIYSEIKIKINNALHDLENNYPERENINNKKRLENLKRECEDYIIQENDINFDYSIKCKKCGFTLSEIISYIELASLKEQKISEIENSFISESKYSPSNNESQKIYSKWNKKLASLSGSNFHEEAANYIGTPIVIDDEIEEPIKKVQKIKLTIYGNKMTVKEYRKLLSSQLQLLANKDDNEDIELIIEELVLARD